MTEDREAKAAPYYTLSEAAAVLGLSRDWVCELGRIGKLRTLRTAGGKGWLVEADSVMALKREREVNPPRRGRARMA